MQENYFLFQEVANELSNILNNIHITDASTMDYTQLQLRMQSQLTKWRVKLGILIKNKCKHHWRECLVYACVMALGSNPWEDKHNIILDRSVVGGIVPQPGVGVENGILYSKDMIGAEYSSDRGCTTAIHTLVNRYTVLEYVIIHMLHLDNIHDMKYMYDVSIMVL